MTDNQQELLTEGTVEQESRDITVTLGSLLKAAREAKGLSIEDIAGRLRLRSSLVRDIEADKFDDISSTIYARGYVRNYARIVDVDESQVMACLAQQLPSEAEPAMQSFSHKTARQARDSRLMMVTWLIAIVLAALLVLWWAQKSSMSTDIDPSRPSAEEVAAAVELGATAAGEPVIDTAALADNSSAMVPAETPVYAAANEPTVIDTVALADNSSAMVPAETPVYAAANEPTLIDTVAATETPQSIHPLFAEKLSAESPVTADVAQGSLTVSLTGDCWMKVTDATGNILIEGLKEAGRIMIVNGTAPFNLVVGSPQVVMLQYNGENISLADYPAGKVARFSLPLE